MNDVYVLNATNATLGVAWTAWYYKKKLFQHMQPQKNTVIRTTGTCTGPGTYTTVTVGGCGGRMGTTGTMNAVPTGMECECATTVVVHGQWRARVGTMRLKNELIRLL